MAQIPIFDGAQGQQEASIRPTRIGPEEPRSTVGESISGGVKEITAVARQMSYMKDGNDLNAGNLALTNHFNTVKQTLESQPLSQFTTKDAYMAQAQQLSDPTKTLQGFSGYSPRVQRMLAANAEHFQKDFLNQQTNNSIVLWHHSILYNMENNLNGYAQSYGQAPPDEALSYKTWGNENIDQAVQHGALSPQEGASRKQKFDNQLDVSALSNMINEPGGAAHAGQILTGSDWNKQFPSLTPEQRMAGINQVHTILTRQMNASNDELKQQTSQAEAEFMNRWHSGTLTPGWADEQVQHFPSLRNYYTAAFGKKPPSEGNGPAFQSLMQQLNDPNLKLEDLDKIREQAAGVGLNAQESKAFTDAATSRGRGMHSALDLSRRDAGTNFKAQLSAYAANLPPLTDKRYDLLHGKGSFKAMMAGEENRYNNLLAHANSPEEVDKVVQSYGAIKDHLPALAGEGGSTPSKSSAPTLPPEGSLPPSDASRKYPSLAKIKIPGA